MTTHDVIQHWRTRAVESLELAKLAHAAENNADALFHCHLAIEKTLKAAVMEKTGQPHPKIHGLLRLALLLQEEWPDDDRELLDTLTDFSVAARYDDPDWAKQFATTENAQKWILATGEFLSRYHNEAK